MGIAEKLLLLYVDVYCIVTVFYSLSKPTTISQTKLLFLELYKGILAPTEVSPD